MVVVIMIDWQRRVQGQESKGPLRSSRIPRYPADFWYVFESARVGGLNGELFADSLEAVLRDGCHAGVLEGVKKLLVLVGRHQMRQGGAE